MWTLSITMAGASALLVRKYSRAASTARTPPCLITRSSRVSSRSQYEAAGSCQQPTPAWRHTLLDMPVPAKMDVRWSGQAEDGPAPCRWEA